MKIQTAQFVHAAHSPDDFLRDRRPEIALVGRSNVGKSSLLNRIVGRNKLARISSTPGRTRAINYFLINDRFYLADLPGYGYAKVSKTDRAAWGRLMDAYFQQADLGSARVQLIDAKVGATPLDIQAWEYLDSLGSAGVVVATKIDKIGRSKQAAALKSIREDLGLLDEEIIPFSARTGEGVKQLWRAIDNRLSG